jgi:hypothetical protein
MDHLHDHEFCRSMQLGGIIVHDAANATAQVEENVCVDNDCSEFDDEDP